jgi:GNAT superfamily N-acetyltransferase
MPDADKAGLEIRTAVIGDAEAVAHLVTELGYPTTPPAMRERLTRILADKTSATFVADRDGSVIGVAGAALGSYYEKDGIHCRLAVLVVASTARGLGVGQRLVETVERWAISRGAGDVVLTSALHRGRAHAFYERCGYARTGLRFFKQLNAAGRTP